MNLYSILGVARNATVDLIKAAFRTRVKTHHPDAGGSPEAFAQLKLAYDVLIDDERRQRYDTTGEVHDTSMQSHLHSVAIGVLNRLVLDMITANDDPSTLDLKQVGRAQLQQNINKMKEQLYAFDEAMNRAMQLQGRWSTNQGDNILGNLVDHQLMELQRNRANVEGQIAAHQLAISILENHTFRPEINQSIYVYERSYYGFGGNGK